MIKKPSKSTIPLADMLNDASIDRVMAIDTDWTIVAWNKTSEIVSGIKKEEALNKHLMEIFPQLKDDIEMTQAFECAMQGKKSFLPAKPRLFNRAYYENHFIPLHNEEGDIIGVMNIMHDVVHRIKAERQLQQLHAELQESYRQLQKANAELATFTSITGNDLKEPIKKVYTTLELMMIHDGAKLSNSSRAGLRRMQASLNRINLLLDDILALSKASSFNREYSSVDLEQVVRRVLQALDAKIKDKQAVIDMQPLPVVTGSEQMLYNLFYNLLDNGIKFQPEGHIPKISISAMLMKGRKETPDVAEGEGWKLEAESWPDAPLGALAGPGAEKAFACIQFSDNGIGFNQTDAERVFTMFEQLHPKKDFPGSGIGLTICRKIAEAHGGYMEAESVQGKGSTFRCYLPLKPGAAS